MLNKELLLSLENSDPILMRVGANEFTWARFGYERSHNPFGSINRIPVWYTGGGSLLLSALYYDENRDRTYIRSDSYTKDQVDLTITILGRSTQLSLLGAGANFATERDPLNLKELWDKTVQVTFDPPPQTDTSIHNSNEASTEESVDAQQRITVDRWREFRCYGCSEDYTRSRRCSSCNNVLQFTRRAVDVFQSSSTDPTARNCGIHSQGKERCFDRDIWRNKRLGNYESHTKRCGGTHWVDTCKPHPYTRQLHNRGLHDYLLTSQEALCAE